MMKHTKIHVALFIFTGFIPSISLSYELSEVLGSTVKWAGADTRIRTSAVSFPSGSSYRTAVTEVINQINNDNPTPFEFNLTYDDNNVWRGNDQNEIWSSTDQDILHGAPAVCWWWGYIYMVEADVIFDAGRSDWYSGTTKSVMQEYGGSYKPFRSALVHELGHAMGLAHENDEYNIMGEDYTHMHANSNTATAYLGEDAVDGLVDLYGTRSSNREDLGVVHWRWSGRYGEYSLHDRTRMYDASGNQLSTVSGEDEVRFWVEHGQTIQVEFTYENNGKNSQSGIHVGYYISENDNITTRDRRIGGSTSMSMTRNSVYTKNTVLTLPDDLESEKDYYLGVIIDENDAISEVWESNNATYTGIKVRAYTPTPTPTWDISVSTRIPVFTPSPTPRIIATFMPFFSPTPTPTPIIIPTRFRPETYVIVTDKYESDVDYSDHELYGSLIDPTIIIRWNLPNVSANDFHVYLQRESDERPVYLGRTGENTDHFVWKPNTRFLSPQFQNGPQNGESYRFYVYAITPGGTSAFVGPYSNAGPVKFMTTQTSATPTPTEPPVVIDRTPIVGPTSTPSPRRTPAIVVDTPSPTPTRSVSLGEVTVTDDLSSLADLSNGTDTDSANERELVVRWNVSSANLSDVHVYVSVDGGPLTYLGRTGSGVVSYLRWYPNAPLLHPTFKDGPQDGHRYSFVVFFLRAGATPPVIARIANAGPVTFAVESKTVPLFFGEWTQVGDVWHTMLTAQAFQTGLRVCLTYEIGISTFTNYIILTSDLEIPIEIRHEPVDEIVVTATMQEYDAGNWMDLAGLQFSTSPNE